MKVASVVSSSFGFRDPGRTPARLDLLPAISQRARAAGAQLVVLPFGFVTAPSEAALGDLVQALARPFLDAGLSVVGGVDVAEPGLGPKGMGAVTEARVREGTLPFHLVVAGVGAAPSVHRQRSTNAQNGGLVPPSAMAPRLLEIDGQRVAASACGELFHAGLREQIAAARPDLVLDVAHSGMGRTFQLLLPKLARESGAWVMNAQHMAENNPHVAKWRLDPSGGNQSATIPDARFGTREGDAKAYGLWAELSLFDIPPRPRDGSLVDRGEPGR